MVISNPVLEQGSETMIKAASGHEFNGAIIGMTLGDSYIQLPRGCVNPRIRTQHAADHRDYLEWKRVFCSPYISGEVKPTKSTVGDKAYYAWYWLSECSHRLKYHRQDFYPHNVKIVKMGVLNRLTSLGLALWYMDDGSIRQTKHRLDGVQLATNGFDQLSLETIIRWFDKQMGLKFTEKTGYLYSDSASAWRFLSIIKPYVDLVPSMRYKADMNRFKIGSSRAFRFLPEGCVRRLIDPVDNPIMRGYVWQLFPKSALWHTIACINCGAEIERKIASLYCSSSCGVEYRRNAKDIVRPIEETLS